MQPRQAPIPAAIAVHRLNRTEYANSIRDLLALDVDAQTLLRPDETGYGFDNIADVLTISPGLMEEYKLAAWKISRLAVGDPTIRPSVATYKVSRFLDQEYRISEELPFGSRGGTVIHHTFPLDGEYSLRIVLQRAYAQNVIKGLQEREQIDVRINGEPIELFAIGGECVGSKEPRCVAFQPKLNVVSGVRVLPAEYDLYADKDLEVRFPAKAGPATITVAFLARERDCGRGRGRGAPAADRLTGRHRRRHHGDGPRQDRGSFQRGRAEGHREPPADFHVSADATPGREPPAPGVFFPLSPGALTAARSRTRS